MKRESDYNLNERVVVLYLQGGWEFAGRVEFVSDKILVLRSNLGSLVIYREKVVGAMILNEEEESESTPAYHVVRPENRGEELELLGNNHYGSIIPEDMLEGQGPKIPVDFSIGMFDLKHPRTKEEKYGPSKKDSDHRKENSE